MAAFSSEPHKAKKEYTCWTCEKTIKAGDFYIRSAGTNQAGDFVTTIMCVECTFVATQKDSTTFQQGCFTDIRIPNCLRKVRNDFRVNPKAAAEKYKVFEIKSEPPKPCKQIVVKATELNRSIFHLPESRYKTSQFAKGSTLTVKAGINGKSRTVTIKGAWSTDGTAFGSDARQVAILIDPHKSTTAAC